MKNILILSARKPESSNRDSYRGILENLAGHFNITYAYAQAQYDMADDNCADISEGIEYEYLRGNKDPVSMDYKISEMIKSSEWDYILFFNHIDLRYFIPKIRKYNTGNAPVVLILAGYCNRVCSPEEDVARDNYRFLFENKFLERVSVLNYVDVILTEDTCFAEGIKNIFGGINVHVVDNMADNKSGLAEGMSGIYRKSEGKQEIDVFYFGEKNPEEIEAMLYADEFLPRITVDKIRENPLCVEIVNRALGSTENRFAFLMLSDINIYGSSIVSLVRCLESISFAGMAIPGYEVEVPVSSSGFDSSRMRIDQFAVWSPEKVFPRSGFMISKEVIETIGLFDEEFNCVEYAGIDFVLRAFEKGFLTVRVGEALVGLMEERKCYEKQAYTEDARYLRKKWPGYDLGSLDKIIKLDENTMEGAGT